MKKLNRILSEWFYSKPATGEKVEYGNGLQIKETIVSKSFMDGFKWDSHLFKNIKIIQNC